MPRLLFSLMCRCGCSLGRFLSISLPRNLPFALGECIGKTMRVDNEARGLISDKFSKTRVQLVGV